MRAWSALRRKYRSLSALHRGRRLRSHTSREPSREVQLRSKTAAQIISAAPDINSEGIVEWGVRNIIPIVLLFIGIAIIAGARKGQMSQNAMTITNVLLGCMVIDGAALFYGFADNIATFVFAKG